MSAKRYPRCPKKAPRTRRKVFCREPPSSLTISIVSGTIACSNRTLTKLNSVTVAKPTDRAQNFWHWLRWPDSCWNPIPSRIGCQRAADHASAIARMSSPEALTKPPEMQQAPKPHGTAQTRRLSLQIVHYQHHGLCSSKTDSRPANKQYLTHGPPMQSDICCGMLRK